MGRFLDVVFYDLNGTPERALAFPHHLSLSPLPSPYVEELLPLKTTPTFRFGLEWRGEINETNEQISSGGENDRLESGENLAAVPVDDGERDSDIREKEENLAAVPTDIRDVREKEDNLDLNPPDIRNRGDVQNLN